MCGNIATENAAPGAQAAPDAPWFSVIVERRALPRVA